MRGAGRAVMFGTAAIALAALPTAAQTPIAYNELGYPLPAGVTFGAASLVSYSTGAASDTAHAANGVTDLAAGLRTGLAVSAHATLDCADVPDEVPPSDTLLTAPAPTTTLRVGLRNGIPTQRVRFSVWSDGMAPVHISTAGWADAIYVAWPGGDVRFALESCSNFAYTSLLAEPRDVSPNNVATEAHGSVYVASGDAVGTLDWDQA